MVATINNTVFMYSILYVSGDQAEIVGRVMIRAYRSKATVVALRSVTIN